MRGNSSSISDVIGYWNRTKRCPYSEAPKGASSSGTAVVWTVWVAVVASLAVAVSVWVTTLVWLVVAT